MRLWYTYTIEREEINQMDFIINQNRELEQCRANLAHAGYTTVVDYQLNELTVIDPLTHEVEVYRLGYAHATYYVV